MGSAISDHGIITVRAALQFPSIKRGVPEVMAGREHLDRAIRWVHAGEVLNMPSLLKGGELLLTAGMALVDSPARQRRFVVALSEREIAALVIELGAALFEMPPALLDAAEAHGLPVIALHREVRFVEITEELHHEIVNRQAALRRQGEELHRRFTALMLDGADVADILAALSETIANPVILEKADFGSIYHATHQSPTDAVLAALAAARRNLPGAFEIIDRPVPTSGHEPWGQLVAVGMDTPLTPLDAIALEQTVDLIAVALVRSREEERLIARERGNFLAALLEEADLDEVEARDRANAMAFGPHNEAMLPIAIGNASPADLDRHAWNPILRKVQRALHERHVPFIAGSYGGKVLAVLGIRSGNKREPAAELVASLVHTAAAQNLASHTRAVVCVGRTAASWTGVGEGLREAVRALPSASHGRSRTWHDATQPDLESLFWSLRNESHLKAFAEAQLAPLIVHDQRRKVKLLDTLSAYCEHGAHKAETARSLHLERQTLYNRLRRIEEVLDVQLSDAETLLGLHIALRAYRCSNPDTGGVRDALTHRSAVP